MSKRFLRAAQGMSVSFLASLSFALAPTASAATNDNIGSGAYSRFPDAARCENISGSYGCLWYSYSSTEAGIAYFWANGDAHVADLTPARFAGGGSGNGAPVRNDAAGMDCTFSAFTDCESYYYKNFGGNWDYALYGHGGRLNLTWNNEASWYVD